jgi:serine phosphatase RsbU (regulator of sigma subunit)
MKKLLKQEDETSISNAGFDGAVIYYNKENKVFKYSGANTPLFYLQDGELRSIKGDRHSIGYKKSDAKYEFSELNIEVKEGMQFYLATDGYLDQNGGEKGFPFGKKKFENIIRENYFESFADQQEVFLDELISYQKDEERNDDVTVIGIKI